MFKKTITASLTFVLFSLMSCFAKENLKIKDFCKINIGTKRADIEKFIGKPQEKSKSNFIYNLDYECKMKLIYKNDKLNKIFFIDPCKREYQLKSNQTSISSNAKIGILPSGPNQKNRTISINDFCKVKEGMKYNKVVNLIGPNTGSIGFGMVWDVYEFPDSSYMKLWYNNNNLAFLNFVDCCNREYASVN